MNVPHNYQRSIAQIILAVAVLSVVSTCSHAANSSANPPTNESTPTSSTATSSTPKPSDRKSAEVKPITAPPSTPESSQAKEYEKLERSRKRAETQKKIEAFLTQDQVKQLGAKLQQGEKMRKALSEMNLTAEQRTKIEAVFKAGHPNRDKVNTDDQKR
jgi:Spy/CpxP family protein refolding chaperone